MGNLATIIDRFFQKKNANNFKIIILYLFFFIDWSNNLFRMITQVNFFFFFGRIITQLFWILL